MGTASLNLKDNTWKEYVKQLRKKKEDTDKELPLQLSYKGQIIMGITIQSIFWYKR